MSGEHTDRRPQRRPYSVGTQVEIRNRFDRSWTRGFRVHGVTESGAYRIARVSDDSVIPSEFDPEEVRRVRKNTLWWV